MVTSCLRLCGAIFVSLMYRVRMHVSSIASSGTSTCMIKSESDSKLNHYAGRVELVAHVNDSMTT
jgi:hypothetical protein